MNNNHLEIGQPITPDRLTKQKLKLNYIHNLSKYLLRSLDMTRCKYGKTVSFDRFSSLQRNVLNNV